MLTVNRGGAVLLLTLAWTSGLPRQQRDCDIPHVVAESDHYVLADRTGPQQ